MTSTGWQWTRVLGRLAVAAGIGATAWGMTACTPTTSVGDAGVVAKRLEAGPGSGYLLVGDTMSFNAFPVDTHENPVLGAKVRWRVEDPSVVTLVGPVVTTSFYITTNTIGGQPPDWRVLVRGARPGTTRLIGTLEGMNTSSDPVTGQPNTLTVTIPITVTTAPARLTIEPRATFWRPGQSLRLRARVFASDGTEILNLDELPYKVVFRCLDPDIGTFAEDDLSNVDPTSPPNGSVCQKDETRLLSTNGTLTTGGYPALVPTSIGANALGRREGSARYEAVLARRDPASQVPLPDLRAQVEITFSNFATRIGFDPPQLTLRIGNSADVTLVAEDAAGHPLPTGDLAVIVDGPNHGAGSDIAQAVRTPTGARVTATGIRASGENTATLVTSAVEGLALTFSAWEHLPTIEGHATVTVLPRVLDLEVPSDITVFEGETKTFPARIVLAPGTTWPILEGSNRIDDAGGNVSGFVGRNPEQLTVTGRSAGPTGIAHAQVTYAPFGEGFTKQFAVTVRRTLLAVSPAQARVDLGAEQAFALNRVGQNGGVIAAVANIDIAWSTGDATVATIDPFGKATCTQKGGSVAISGTLRAASSQSASASLTCGAAPSPTITISPASVQVEVGKAVPLVAAVVNGNGAGTVTWSSNSPNVTVVGGTPPDAPTTAKVTGVSVTDEAIVTATYTQGSFTTSAQSRVKVVAPAPAGGYTVAPGAVTVTPGGGPTTASLTVTRTGGLTAGIAVTGVSGAPAGLTVAPSATSFTGNTLGLNVAATSAVGVGTYPVAVTTLAVGTTLTQTTTLTVTVSTSAGVRIAAIYFDPRKIELTAPTSVTVRARLFDTQGNQVAIPTGGTITFSLGALSANPVATITPLGGGLALVKGNVATPFPETIRATYTPPAASGGQTLTDQTSLTVYASGSAGHYGAVELLANPDVRHLKVGDVVSFEVLVRDVNGIKLSACLPVQGQPTPTDCLTFPYTESPAELSAIQSALQITRDTSKPGWVYTVKALAPTALSGVELRADMMGAAGSAIFLVTP